MRIEIHLPSGRLLAVNESWSRGTNFFIARLGNGQHSTCPRWRCIPHSTMCGPFSLSPRIAAQSKQLAARNFREASVAAHVHVQEWGIAP